MTRAGKRRLDSHGPLAPRDLDRPCGLDSPPVRQDLLERFFPVVRTLRQHILFKLPAVSRLRRRKIATLGSRPDCGSLESRLAHALDNTLVCAGESPTLPDSAMAEAEDLRWQQWVCFSQKGDDSNITLSDGVASAIAVQSEIVDFVIWLLFSRHGSCGGRPNHLLCDGLRRGVAANDTRRTAVPGVIALHPNARTEAIKQEPWPHVLALLGRSGQRIMINMLMDCSLFVKVDAGLQNYYQYTGIPLHGLTMGSSGSPSTGPNLARKLSEITLVRSRIFYAKPTLSSSGVIQSGFKHIHALNRFRYVREPGPEEKLKEIPNSQAPKRSRDQNDVNTLKLLMYIFPRQFGLHNVFTSEVDVKQTSQAFQDYTLRPEEDLLQKPSGADKVESGDQSKQLPKVPKRLRGPVMDLVRRLQILHGRCSYFQLLRHYCPASIDNLRAEAKANVETVSCAGSRSKRKSASQWSVRSGPRCKQQQQQHRVQINRELRSRRFASSQGPCELKYNSLVDVATPYAHVSAFCQAVFSKIIPDQFWGDGPASHNKTVFLSRIDHFIKLRRFEAISLHEIAQDFKISDMAWLQPPNCQGSKASQTDTDKRRELFHEFLYYVFDSLLIPLIRSHFYVTETNSHRLQIFYFRHDIWRVVADSALSDLKTGMFEEIKSDEVKSILSHRRLGFGLMRLLPKGRKMRPITNLKRRSLPLTRDPRMPKILGPSVNSILQPVHAMLKHEKDMNPSKLGSALFAVGDMYGRIKSFKRSLPPGKHVFYFAKLDVTAAFDTIPQSAVVQLMRSIPRQKTYVMTKHIEMKPGDRPLQYRHGSARGRPTRRWFTTAIEHGEPSSFLDRLEGRLGKGKRNTVFIDNPVLRSEDVSDLMSLLAQHVGQNIIKIGKKYYRQKKGIPQGSVLSSFLCNYFYADLEAKYLDFLDGPDCLLMRLIDDFLLITLDNSKAVRFVQVMHQGLPEYGVEVNPSKTMVNFDMSIEGGQIRKVSQLTGFPYCGTFINCETLEISKSHERDSSVHISASLTIHYGRSPGQNFQKKILHAFGLQSHAMFFDTEHNSKATVLRTLRGAFDETARKMWAYLRCLPAARRPSEKLVAHTIFMLANVAFSILTSKSRKGKFESYACDIRKRDITLVAYSAFFDFLTRKQARFGNVLLWLSKELARLRSVAS